MKHLNHTSHAPQLLLLTILSGKCRSYDGLSSLISLFKVISMLIIVLSIQECVQVLNSRVCDVVWEKGPSAEMVV